METPLAHAQDVFPDQSVAVGANLVKIRTQKILMGELVVTHLAISGPINEWGKKKPSDLKKKNVLGKWI